jgi:precorrin-4 methylase
MGTKEWHARAIATGEIQTYPERHKHMTLSTTGCIIIGNNVGKAGTENTFIYTLADLFDNNL